MGWPLLALLAGLLVYFQVSISDPVAKKRATFKIFIGMIAAFMLLMAIAQLQDEFLRSEPDFAGLLGSDYRDVIHDGDLFPQSAALLKIGGFMFFVAAALSGYGNWLPQVEGGFPPKEEKIEFER